jgi:RNA polymerase sigma factor (TIGR02999 family)
MGHALSSRESGVDVEWVIMPTVDTPKADTKTVTELLRDWSGGRGEALDELFAIVYAELRLQARRALSGRRPGHTLQPTSLVHEVYLRLVRGVGLEVSNREHFFNLVRRVMTWIVTDHLRQRIAGNRFPDALRVPLGEHMAGQGVVDIELEELHEALSRLEALDPQQAYIVNLHFFAGMTRKEIAARLKLNEMKVKRELQTAKAWLRCALAPQVEPLRR